MVPRHRLGRSVQQASRPAVRARCELTVPFPTDRQSKRANFDATHELEELLLEENPLKARKRKDNADTEAMSPEMRMMEEQ